MLLKDRRTWAFAVAALIVGLLLGIVLSGGRVFRVPDVVSQSKSGDEKPSVQKLPHSRTPIPIAAVASDGTVSIPIKYQLPGVKAVRATAHNSKEWLSSFTGDEEKLNAFSKKHYGVYSINSPEQIVWMAQNGYPMPEDVIAAEGISSESLRALALAGNEKATYLLRERDIDALKETFDTYAMMGKDRSSFWQSDPAATALSQDEALNSKVMQTSDSPYKGYVLAQESLLASDPVEAAAKVVGGLLWSQSLGDLRVDQYLQTFSSTDPINASVLMGADAASASLSKNILKMRIMGCQPASLAGVIPGVAAQTE